MASWGRGGPGRRAAIVTGHRRENFGAPFEEFCLGLADVARAVPEALLVYPVHLNPNVREPVLRLLSDAPNVRLVEPATYREFIALLALADVAITDSGGVQEEAPALGVPVLVTRTTTERPEAVEAGGVRLVGPDRRRIAEEAVRLLTDESAHRRMARCQSPYGDGRAAERCVAAVLGEAFTEFGAPSEAS